jgi:hypothetical protein
MKYKTLLYILLFAFFAACKPEIDDFAPSKGDADFTRYVAIGSSFTAGFADGELYKTAQQYSYPNILASQLQKVGSGTFNQPLMLDDLGFGSKKVLGYFTDCLEATSLSPLPAGGTPNVQNFESIKSQGPFNNMGVPGAKSFHLLVEGYGLRNPYFGRFATDASSTTVLRDAIVQNPTFFSLGLGDYDVLSYALAGGEADSITNPVAFEQYIGYILQQLTANGAKGVIANVPDITGFPFFTTIPYNGLVLKEQAKVDALNAAYAVLGISFQLGENGFIIQDPAAPAGLRQIQAGELLLLTLPQDSIKCAGWGSQKPIPMKYVLDATEISEITSAITAYNQTLTTLAGQFGLAYVDMNAYIKNIANGMVLDGVTFTSKFITGGFFSLDGIHFNPRGAACTANFFIEAINLKYNANIPKVNVTNFPGVIFP